MLVAILVTGFFLTAALSLPIGVGLGLTGLAVLHFAVGGATDLAMISVWNIFTDFTLSAVPLFIFMGEIMLRSGVSSKLYSAIAPVFARMPGKLLHTNIVVCTIFGSVSGASTSTAAAIGSVAYPELVNRGYDPKTVVGTLAAGGTIGLLIPPSLALLIYGATQQVSIGKLFMAGIIPGILLTLIMMAFIVFNTLRHPSTVPEEETRYTIREIITALVRIWPLGGLVMAVLGTIYLGLATPTEAAGLGVVGAAVLGYAWGTLTWKSLWDAFSHGTLVFVAIGTVMLGAIILAQSISLLGVPFQLLSWVKTLGLSPIAILIAVSIIYLVLGCFFDGISLMLMTLPVVFPVMVGVGFDPVWLGIVITILIEIGMITPPVGMNLFVLTGISEGKVTLMQAAMASLPYWLLLLGTIALLTAFPQIVLFLPGLAYQ
ncbi:TRAP transporter, DctM subunit [Roseovarius lutimaris]|uniref:TRAP transporter large permease protein n=1 Tax=Roseovarius lutimaris TaxID=1005928 RepID=A0A1I5H429_9RHOB|nr:TRAP transporter large permease [Roseovarius lutimaris]SFO42786.1 TRAP transporter, DctM subunit [Roseovarius lutimaris]